MLLRVMGGLEMWLLAAGASALFAGLTSILAKCGIRSADADLVTAIRTAVVLALAWGMAALTVGDLPAALAAISGRSYLFLVLSGLATGASWICYFNALAVGDVNRVVPIDKSSSALAALFAIVLFGETGNLGVRLVAIAAVFAGTMLMVERKKGVGGCEGSGGAGASDGSGAAAPQSGAWLPLAVASAVFAALTSVLAKVGIGGVDSNLATAVRTVVVLAMAWGIVAARGKLGLVRGLHPRELGFIVASGLATGASWLAYYYAIKNGQVSVVVQIDKLSILVSVALSYVVFGERLGRKAAAGLTLMVAATAAMAAIA